MIIIESHRLAFLRLEKNILLCHKKMSRLKSFLLASWCYIS